LGLAHGPNPIHRLLQCNSPASRTSLSLIALIGPSPLRHSPRFSSSRGLAAAVPLLTVYYFILFYFLIYFSYTKNTNFSKKIVHDFLEIVHDFCKNCSKNSKIFS
jgi:hypothetical protein